MHAHTRMHARTLHTHYTHTHIIQLSVSGLVPFFWKRPIQKRPRSYCAKLAQIWSGWPSDVLAKQMFSYLEASWCARIIGPGSARMQPTCYHFPTFRLIHKWPKICVLLYILFCEISVSVLYCCVWSWHELWFTVLFCKISLLLYCSVRSVCHCTDLWDQSVTVLFCEISLLLYCSVRSVCHCTVFVRSVCHCTVVFDLGMRSALYCSVWSVCHYCCVWSEHEVSALLYCCEISLSLYCSVRSVCRCTVLWDQSVIVLFCEISLSLYCSVRSVCHCTVLWDQSVIVLFCEISLSLYCSVRSVCHCTVLWDQSVIVLFWAHLQDLVYNPPSLLELSGRVVKVEKMRYSCEDLPLNLVRYLDSAQRCVNPHCKGRSPTCPMQRFLSCLMWHCVSIHI